ncbi:PAS domain S-box protein [Aporhodopirellula aestuarii]|uniref:histidine kinase n=1 Tax=Aporhodopirellula aestuarii TaxID=2950107 RepID=A0ABT0UCA7_9BACT|nr:PAS domain S-box protein [Aporhodopirellula aestuarii]MCM2374550.1 PAS domain S-box protein [Aporhodopirellula aestuarii]
MSDSQHPEPDAFDFLSGEGEMSRRTREFDWSQTPVGPTAQWPQGLKTALNIMLGSRYAMWLGWGPEFTFFYNDAYAKMTLGPKHPWAFGKPVAEVWPEIWEDVRPRAESVLQTGVATWDEGLLLFLERRGFSEETYHTFSYSPLPSDDGNVGGMLCVVTEDTERTIGERRLRTLRELAARTSEEATSTDEACQNASLVIESNPQDVPFALIYLLESNGQQARRAGLAGVTEEMPTSPYVIDINSDASPWPFKEALQRHESILVDDLVDQFGDLSVGVWPEPPRQAVVLPLAKSGQTQPFGFLVGGLSPRLAFDDSYRGFFDLLAGQIVTAVANARAYEEERRRAEALATLDRAKTTFFSNVSHEFRTPLTLMLGPVEDLLSRSHTDLSPSAKRQLEVVNRNGVRLLRLVNSLLDFSRIEAGRVHAAYQPTDLVGFTSELASVFRSAVERAGLRLKVDCSEIAAPTYVDRDMWEKIVLNLLSNAFKFTLEGEISVTQRQCGDNVELVVGDTGTGIASEHLTRIFERFHRIPNAEGRTHEGSGIGLALVQELVKLHGGSISASSTLGEGTTFTVTIPVGKDHLPSDQVGEHRAYVSTSTGATPFVEEALRWLPDETEEENANQRADANQTHSTDPVSIPTNSSTTAGDDDRPLVLVADDNLDMRQYVSRLLAEHYRVTVVSDGKAALESARSERPDLVLSDVMMPRLDGFGLLQEFRADPQLSEIPVIMLSARAGEESCVEGMEAGADDYLVKPFSARELLARVGAHLKIAQMRIESAESLRQSEERLRMALGAAHMVAWQWDASDDHIVFSDNVGEVFGLDHDSMIGTRTEQLSLIHPDDARNLQTVVESAIQNRGSYVSQYRISRPDNGETLWLEERGHAVTGGSADTIQLAGIVMDITERKRTDEALREREQFLQAIVDTTPECIKLVASDGTLLQMNPSGLSMVGAEASATVTGGCVYDLIAPEDRKKFHEFNERICRGERDKLEFDIVGLTGTRRHMETHAVPLPGPSGEILQLALTRDVTDRKKAEEALRRERDLLSVTLESIGDAVITTDTDGRIVNMNPRSQTLTGWTLEEAAGLPLNQVFRIVNEDTREPRENPAMKALSEGTVVGLANHTTLIRKDGSECPIDDSAAPIRGNHGDVVGCVLVFRDVTQRRQAEAALRESESYFRTMANNAPTMLWTTEVDGACSFLSQGWFDYTGQSEKEGLGEGGFGWLNAVHPDDRGEARQIFLDANARHVPFSIDHRIRQPDGEYRWAINTGRPRFDDAGEFLGFIGSVIDVHERKIAQDFRSRQVRILEMITSERSLHEILTELVSFIELQIPTAFGSILLLAPDGRHLRNGAAPRLPREYNAAVDGIETGPRAGSCGTAIFRGERVVVSDIQSDPLWADFSELANQHHLAACWSQPIRASSGELLGTSAIYFSTPREPTEEELIALEAFAHFAGIAIERPRAQAALRSSEERFRALTNATSDIVYSMNADWTEMRQIDNHKLFPSDSQPHKTWLEMFIPPEDRTQVKKLINRAIESKCIFELEHRVLRSDRTFGWTYSRAIPILDEHGEIIEWFGAASDVTHRKDAEDKLRTKHEELLRFNRAAVGREMRMIELKRQINELCQRLNEPKRFPLEFDIRHESTKA